MRMTLMATLLLLLQGCMTDFVHPIGKPQAVDMHLKGRWSIQRKRKTSYLEIQPTKWKNIWHIHYEEPGKEGIDLFGYSTTLGGHEYFCLKIANPPEDYPKEYGFYQYRLTGDTLRIRLMNPKLIEKAIKAKALKGSIEKHEFLPRIRVEEGSKELTDFFVKHQDQLYSDKGAIFHRVSPHRGKRKTSR